MALREVFLLAILCLHIIHSKSYKTDIAAVQHIAAVQKLSCQQIKQIVDGHNSRRLLLSKGQVSGQPAASEMKYMVWDDELAAKAAKWAAANNKYHNPDKTIGSGRFKTGENLYWYTTSDRSYKLNIDNALASWWNEYKDYKYGPLQRSDFNSNIQIGHYTQMAWADTTHVGCAVLQTQTEKWNKFFVVCNYGPGGNTMGRVPYKSGSPSGKLICTTNNCNRPYGNIC